MSSAACGFFQNVLLGILLINQFCGRPRTQYIHSPDWSLSSFSCASLIFSCNSSFCFFVRSCAVYLLNGSSDCLILFKFQTISHFLSSCFSEMSNGWCLLSIAFPSLIMHSICFGQN